MTRLFTIFIKIITAYICGILSSTQVFASSTQESAITIPEQTIKSEPNNATLFVKTAIANTSIQQYMAANDNYKAAIKLAPTDSHILNQYAIFLCQQKSINDANIMFKSALDHSESTFVAQIYTDLARCNVVNQQIDDAINNYMIALSYDTTPYAAYEGLANLYTAQKKYALGNYYISLYQGSPRPDQLYLRITIMQSLINSELKPNEKRMTEQKLSGLKAQLIELFPLSKEAELIRINKTTLAKLNSPELRTTTYESAAAIVNNNSREKDIVSRIEHDSNRRKYITVQPGDTLYSISKTANVSTEQISSLNKLKSNKVQVGIKLYLPNTDPTQP